MFESHYVQSAWVNIIKPIVKHFSLHNNTFKSVNTLPKPIIVTRDHHVKIMGLQNTVKTDFSE